MDKRPWETLTDIEKREAVALRLGWNSHHGNNCWNPGPCWHPKAWERHLKSEILPDWPSNDGLAFTEVWPKICAAIIARSGGIPKLLQGDLKGTPYECDLEWGYDDDEKHVFIASDSWADAICHAAYDLLEVPGE